MEKESLIKYLKQKRFQNKIIHAFEKVPRENFIPIEYKYQAYEDQPIPIQEDQTTSQPSTIAFMLDLLELKNNQKILEIGSGSGYVLALINQISKNSKIYGVEIIKSLYDLSSKILSENKNIKIVLADGNLGLKQFFPFDRILISASANEIPKQPLTQLKPNGIMVCVVKNSVIKIIKKGNRIKKIEYPGFLFVPLIKKF